MHESPRCGARTRAGASSRAPTVRHKRRSRLHGGVPGLGGQPGNQDTLKYGFYSAAADFERRRIRAWRKGVARSA